MIWIFIIIFLFLIPFPLIINFRYEKNILSVHIYNFKIYTSKAKEVTIKRVDSLYPKFFYIKVLDYIYKKSQHIIFKSSLKLNLHLAYGFNDPYVTGIFYGILHSINAFIYNFISKFFTIKKFDMKFNPYFDKSIFELKIQSIFFINLAKIIYIVLLIYISFRKASKKYLNSSNKGGNIIGNTPYRKFNEKHT